MFNKKMSNPLRYSKILIADDSPFFRAKIKQILKNADIGYYYYTAADGHESILQYKQHRPDLVIMDIIMPNVDGFKATQTIRRMDPKSKIIVISVKENKEIVDDVVNRFGAKDYLLKPLDPGLVVMAVSKQLADRRIKPHSKPTINTKN